MQHIRSVSTSPDPRAPSGRIDSSESAAARLAAESREDSARPAGVAEGRPHDTSVASDSWVSSHVAPTLRSMSALIDEFPSLPGFREAAAGQTQPTLADVRAAIA